MATKTPAKMTRQQVTSILVAANIHFSVCDAQDGSHPIFVHFDDVGKNGNSVMRKLNKAMGGYPAFNTADKGVILSVD